MKVLILSPHTDDAEFSCGGTIIKLLENGDSIRWIVFSTADDSLPEGFEKDTTKKEFYSVIHQLGMSNGQTTVYDYKVRHLHQHRQDILENLVSIRKQFEPELVIGPSLNDLHQDHQVIAYEMVRAFKTSASILCYESPWNHITFNTQCFQRLTRKHIIKKHKLVQNYKSQYAKRKDVFSEEYIYGMAKVRGTQCNADYAEAFEVVRWMI